MMHRLIMIELQSSEPKDDTFSYSTMIFYNRERLDSEVSIDEETICLF